MYSMLQGVKKLTAFAVITIEREREYTGPRTPGVFELWKSFVYNH